MTTTKKVYKFHITPIHNDDSSTIAEPPDITLKIGDDNTFHVRVNRKYLGSRCAYFETMFSRWPDGQESDIDLKMDPDMKSEDHGKKQKIDRGVPYEPFIALLHVIQTGCFEATMNLLEMIAVLKLANMYLCTAVAEKVTALINRQIVASNALVMYREAMYLNLNEISSHALTFVEKNPDSFLTTDKVTSKVIPEEVFKQILESDQLKSNPLNVFRFAITWVTSHGSLYIDWKYILDTIEWDEDPDHFLNSDENDIRSIPEEAFKKILVSENFKSDEIKVYHLAMKWISSRGNQIEYQKYILDTIKWHKIHARDLTQLVAVEGLLPVSKIKLLTDNWIEKYDKMNKTGCNGSGIITIRSTSEAWSTGHNVGGYMWSFRVVNDGSYGCKAYIRFDNRLYARSIRCTANIKVALVPFEDEKLNFAVDLKAVVFKDTVEEKLINFESVREVNPESFGVFTIVIDAINC